MKIRSSVVVRHRHRPQQERILMISMLSILSIVILLVYNLPIYIRQHDDIFEADNIELSRVTWKDAPNNNDNGNANVLGGVNTTTTTTTFHSNDTQTTQNNAYDSEYYEWGGVLPIRRFQIKPNTGIKLTTLLIDHSKLKDTSSQQQQQLNTNRNTIFDITLTDGQSSLSSSSATASLHSLSMKRCNKYCLERYDCDAWEFHFNYDNETSLEVISNITCSLYAQPQQNWTYSHDQQQSQVTPSSTLYNSRISSSSSLLPPPYGPSCGRPYTKLCPKPGDESPAAKNRVQPLSRHSFLAAYQAPNNDVKYAVGFIQRFSRVLTRQGIDRNIGESSSSSQKNRRRWGKQSKPRVVDSPHNQRHENDDKDDSISNRVLVVLHYHHPIPSLDHMDLLLNTLLKQTLSPKLFDIVVVTPRPEPLSTVFQTNTTMRITTLVNPLVPKDDRSKFGSNSYMSLPIAYAKFPGYKGYLLMNDDVSVRMFDLMNHPEIWFDQYPWCTEPMRKPNQTLPRMEQEPQQALRDDAAYAGWKWWNKDSGSTSWPPAYMARNNFDASLAALNEFCDIAMTSSSLMNHQDESRRAEFCSNRSRTTLVPFKHSKGDVLYVPNTPAVAGLKSGSNSFGNLGLEEMKALKLFGEHDVFLEVAVPMVYNLVVPDHLLLSVPYCNFVPELFVPHLYQPYYSRAGEVLSDLRCSVLHPTKFSDAANVRFWQSIINEECGEECASNAKIYWKLRSTA